MNYYIDLNAGDGLGTEASPFSFAQIKTNFAGLSGDQSGDNYYFKKGGSASGFLEITSANNFNINTYGVGARPIIDGLGFDFALDIRDTHDVEARGMHLKRAKKACFRCISFGIDLYNVRIFDCEASDASGVGLDAQDGFLLNGDSVTPSVGMVFAGNVTNGNANNGLEMSYMDGLIIRGNSFNNDASNAVEYWNQCVNCIQENNVANGNLRLFWFANQAGTHSTNIIRNERGYNLLGVPFKIENADLTTVNNCTVHCATGVGSGRQGLLLRTSTNTEFKNNILYLAPSANVNSDFILWSDAASIATLTSDNNMYYEIDGDGDEKSPHRYFDGTTLHTTIATWRTATGEDANSTVENPLFVDAVNGDLRLTELSPALYETFTEAAGLVASDAIGDRRYDGIDIGALQFKRHAEVSVGISM